MFGKSYARQIPELPVGPVTGEGIAVLETNIYEGIEPPSSEDISWQRQNPANGLTTLLIQNKWMPYGIGKTNSFSIEPSWPIRLAKNWEIITYTVIPFQRVPGPKPGTSSDSGLGNISLEMLFHPDKPESFISWGLGPFLLFPAHSELGFTSFSIGPSLLLYLNGGICTGGIKLRNCWSTGAHENDRVNLFSSEYYFYFNLPEAWYFQSNATITANWLTASTDRWLIPVGGGPGKTFRIGNSKSFYSAGIQGFWNVVRPDSAGSWMLSAQFQIIFSG